MYNKIRIFQFALNRICVYFILFLCWIDLRIREQENKIRANFCHLTIRSFFKLSFFKVVLKKLAIPQCVTLNLFNICLLWINQLPFFCLEFLNFQFKNSLLKLPWYNPSFLRFMLTWLYKEDDYWAHQHHNISPGGNVDIMHRIKWHLHHPSEKIICENNFSWSTTLPHETRLWAIGFIPEILCAIGKVKMMQIRERNKVVVLLLLLICVIVSHIRTRKRLLTVYHQTN